MRRPGGIEIVIAHGRPSPPNFAARTSAERAWPSKFSRRAARPQMRPNSALDPASSISW